MSVTEILNHISPFDDIAKRLWVEGVNLDLKGMGKPETDYDTLMVISQTMGDIIHTYFIEVAMGFPTVGLPRDMKQFEAPIKQFILLHKIKGLACEFTIEKAGEYTGHPDLIVMMEWEGKMVKALIDVKTYGLYRFIMGLPEKPLKPGQKKPPILGGNRPKVSLQTSMYRDALMGSKNPMVSKHWNVSHLFCFHIKPTEVECVLLKYETLPYLEWRDKQDWWINRIK